MLDQNPWTHIPSVQKEEAMKYHKRVQELTLEELQVFADTEVLKHEGTVDELVDKIQTFMNCLLPYRLEALRSHIQGVEDFVVYIHEAMCPLGHVTGKTDDGVKLGEDCSYFGRFHGRLEEYFFTCMRLFC